MIALALLVALVDAVGCRYALLLLADEGPGLVQLQARDAQAAHEGVMQLVAAVADAHA